MKGSTGPARHRSGARPFVTIRAIEGRPSGAYPLGAMKPVAVQVIAYAPTIFYHCQHCELAFQEMGIGERLRRREAAEALPEDLANEFQAVSDWVHALLIRHGARVRVDVLDAASIKGVLTSVRHRVARYPAVIVAGERAFVGLDFAAADDAIDRKVAAATPQPAIRLPRRTQSVVEGRNPADIAPH